MYVEIVDTLLVNSDTSVQTMGDVMDKIGVQNDKLSETSQTVSYTHLDVYKRQILCQTMCGASG